MICATLFLIGLYIVCVALGLIWRPAIPTLLFGIIWGPVRMENDDGGEVYSNDAKLSILFWHKPTQLFLDESKYYITHVQYRSRFGLLLFWPMIFHFWTQPRLQKTRPNPNADHDPDIPTLRVPGSELCLPYGRLPGWRRERGGYILSKGFFGGHWD